MMEWTAEREGARSTFQVVKWENGRRVDTRRHLTGLSCIAAQVIAAELNRAYEIGVEIGKGLAYDHVMAMAMAKEGLGD